MPPKSHRNAKRQPRRQPHTPTNYPSTPLEVSVSTIMPPQLSLHSQHLIDLDPESEVERGGVIGGDDNSSSSEHSEQESPTGSGRVRGEPQTQRSPPPNSENIVRSPDHFEARGPSGHVRSPVLVREPTMLENLSRTVRNYVPASIPIPNSTPSSPRVTRPVSFGNYGNHGRGADWQIRHPTIDGVFASDEDDDRAPPSYPRVDEGDPVLWARWDTLFKAASPRLQKRILLLGYATGLQIWDCTRLDSVTELLNLPSAEWGTMSYAAVVPRPAQLPKDDLRGMQQPLIGIISRLRDETTFILYSLSRHHIVKRLALPGLSTFLSNEHFIVLTTTNPNTLHILSASTFGTLFTIPSSSLISFAHPSSNTNNNNTYNSVLLEPDVVPHPVCALSRRFLAYASPPPRPDSFRNAAARQPRTRSPVGASGAGEIGNAALKVGGSVFSGLKSLGGLAISAAMSRAGLTDPGPKSATTPGQRFFSRSAPTGSSRDRRYSSASSSPAGGYRRDLSPSPEHSHEEHQSTSASPTNVIGTVERGHFVTVVDLEPLLRGAESPTRISEFMALRSQSVSDLAFSSDGTCILVTPKDGQVSKVFQIRPAPRAGLHLPVVPATRRRSLPASKASPPRSLHGPTTGKQDSPWHLYDLRRGRTSAIIEDIDWASDGRWIALGTRNRTVHVFAVNPNGGKPDQRSHVEGRVKNSSELPLLSVEVAPVVRLRAAGTPAPDEPRIPLAFTFIKSSEWSHPQNLLPSLVPSRPSSVSSDALHSEPGSPHVQRQANFQDVLIFDPTDGRLSLRRFFVEIRSTEQGLSVPLPASLGGTSISLPKMGGAGRLSSSPHSPGGGGKLGNLSSGLSQMMEGSTDMYCRESVIATWALQRRRDWGEIKAKVEEPSMSQDKKVVQTDWLAHAELSTFSRSPAVLPRTIYLSHQFTFHALGEDYHALVRRYQLDIGGRKLDVRREVEVSAYSAGIGGESFVEGYPVLRNIRRASSSFDEPLASALGAGLDYARPPAVLPMLPNGVPGGMPASFRNSIPIRTISDGMSEGIGRLRREIHKTRSPPLLARSDSRMSESVPLEFDEEDEDFLTRGDSRPGELDESASRTTSHSRGEGDSGVSISTPASVSVPLNEGDDVWQGWGPEDNQAVEEAERFDNISVVGFLDEEQAAMETRTEKRKGRKRHR